MIYNAFSNVYTKFKMHFYQEVFKKWGNLGGIPGEKTGNPGGKPARNPKKFARERATIFFVIF